MSESNDHFIPNAFQITVMYSVALGALLLNIPVFLIVPRLHEKINLSTRYGMLNLAMTDSLLGLEHLVGRTIYLTKPNTFLRHFCQVDGMFNSFLLSLSISGLTFLNLDKFLALKFPLRYWIWMTRKKTIGIIVGLWLSWVVIGAGVLGGGVMDVHVFWESIMCLVGGGDMDSSALIVMIIVCVLFQVIPLCIALVSSIGMYCILKRHKREASNLQEGQQIIQRNERSIVYTIFALNFIFILMISSFCIFYAIWEIVTGYSLTQNVHFAVMWLAAANSVINPLIYIPSLRSYRKELKDGLTALFKKGSCRKYSSRSRATETSTHNTSETL